jgi:hypothetical protein
MYENESIESVVIANEPTLGGIESEAFQKTDLKSIIIPDSVDFFGLNCFSLCRSLFSVPLESGSILSRIEKQAFIGTGLIEITLSSSVEVLGVE